MASLNDQERALFEAPNFGHFATLTADGYPHASTVWVDLDGDDILVNSELSRAKVTQARANSKVGISVADSANPYHTVSVMGDVVEVTEEGAAAHIDKLAKKYLGVDDYPYNQPGDVRVIIRVRPTTIKSLFM